MIRIRNRVRQIRLTERKIYSSDYGALNTLYVGACTHMGACEFLERVHLAYLLSQ